MSRDKFDIQSLLDKGYSLVGDMLIPPANPTFKQKAKITQAFKDIGGLAISQVIIDESTTLSLPKDSVLTINGLVAGLNGSKGLMRGHWSAIKKQKTLYQQIIQQHLSEHKMRKHTGEVTVEYIGYKSRFMDWDNFCASFKHIGDALVKMKIIVDDNPKIIIQFIPSQIKCKQTEQKVVIIIKDK